MKISFINPNPIYTPNFHMGIISLGAKLYESGHDVSIFDFGYYEDYYKVFKEGLPRVLDEKPEVVGITTRCDDYPIALDIAKQIILDHFDMYSSILCPILLVLEIVYYC